MRIKILETYDSGLSGIVGIAEPSHRTRSARRARLIHPKERSRWTRSSFACSLPGQLPRQESNRSLPRKLGCRGIIRVRSVFLEKPVRRPRVCVEREVLYPRAEVLLEISYGGGGLKFVRLCEMTEEGRFDVGIVSISRPIEEDDRSNVRGELLRQPKTPECPHGKADDSEVLSLHPRMAL